MIAVVPQILAAGREIERHCKRRWWPARGPRGHLVPARHQRAAGELHDWAGSMGGVRRDRSRSGDRDIVGCQQAERQALEARLSLAQRRTGRGRHGLVRPEVERIVIEQERHGPDIR